MQEFFSSFQFYFTENYFLRTRVHNIISGFMTASRSFQEENILCILRRTPLPLDSWSAFCSVEEEDVYSMHSSNDTISVLRSLKSLIEKNLWHWWPSSLTTAPKHDCIYWTILEERGITTGNPGWTWAPNFFLYSLLEKWSVPTTVASSLFSRKVEFQGWTCFWTIEEWLLEWLVFIFLQKGIRCACDFVSWKENRYSEFNPGCLICWHDTFKGRFTEETSTRWLRGECCFHEMNDPSLQFIGKKIRLFSPVSVYYRPQQGLYRRKDNARTRTAYLCKKCNSCREESIHRLHTF